MPPTETIRVVVRREDERRLIAARWGFRPFWADDEHKRAAQTSINARAETAWDSPAFGEPSNPPLRDSRRRLLRVGPHDVATAAVRHRSGGRRGDAGNGRHQSPIHGEMPTAAIMTTAPNELLASVHNRMPVILDRDALEVWLDPEADLGHVQSLLRPAPDTSLRMWPVGTAVNKVAADGPELLRPIELAPTLGLA